MKLLQDGEVGLIYNKDGKDYAAALHIDEHKALQLLATCFKTITISEKLQVELKSNMLDILKDIEPELWVRLKFLQINERVNINKQFGTKVIVLDSGHGGNGYNVRKLRGECNDCKDLHYILDRNNGSSLLLGKRALYTLLFENYCDLYIEIINESSLESYDKNDRLYKLELLKESKD